MVEYEIVLVPTVRKIRLSICWCDREGYDCPLANVAREAYLLLSANVKIISKVIFKVSEIRFFTIDRITVGSIICITKLVACVTLYVTHM